MRKVILLAATLLIIALSLFPPNSINYRSTSGMSTGTKIQHRPLWAESEWTEEYGNVKYESSVNMERYGIYLVFIIGLGLVGYIITSE